MMNFGKILFFNENEGKGIIITSQKEKIDFIVNEWNDFDIMPSLGLEVVFNLKDKKALNILSKESSKLQKNEPSIVHVQQEIKPEEIIKETLKEIVSISELTQELASEIETEIETEIDTEVETEVEEELEYDDDEELEYDDESRPESITISINIATAISNYFTKIKEHLEHRSVYKKVPGSLDYVLIKRFLFTTFNNLSDIDLHIFNLI